MSTMAAIPASTLDPVPQVHLQINNNGAWKTLSVIGLNSMDRCRKAVDVLCKADQRTRTRGSQPTYRLALATPAGGFDALQYRDPAQGWFEA